MTPESTEQLTDRIERRDREREEAFQKRLKEIHAGNARWCAEQEEKERAEAQKRQKLLDDARHKREQEMKDRARMTWLGADGTGEEFEEAWPSLRTEMLRRRTLEDETNARAAQRRGGISSL